MPLLLCEEVNAIVNHHWIVSVFCSGHHKHAKIRQNASCFANIAFSYNLHR